MAGALTWTAFAADDHHQIPARSPDEFWDALVRTLRFSRAGGIESDLGTFDMPNIDLYGDELELLRQLRKGRHASSAAELIVALESLPAEDPAVPLLTVWRSTHHA